MKFLSEAVWKVFADEIAAKRIELAKAHERIDRLVEALGRKHDVTVSMPMAPRERLPLEPSPGYFDSKPISPITTTGGTKK